MKIAADIHYYDDFLEDHREVYRDVLEEFFTQEPELIHFGGPRISGMAFKTDRPNSYTRSVDLKRSAIRRRLWLPVTGAIAGQICSATGVMPSIAVFNFYRDGEDHLNFHSDYDRAIGPRVANVVVATVSLGIPRTFGLRKVDGSQHHEVTLEPGSLFVMRGKAQRQWLHSVPKSDDLGSRLSITYLHEQLDPEEDRCWVLSELTDDAREAMLDMNQETEFGEVVRNYKGDIPRPVLIASKQEVFVEWCRRPHPENYVVVGGPVDRFDSYLNPRALLKAYPDLWDHVPVDVDMKPESILPPDLPNPDTIPWDTLPTEWLGAMMERAQEELNTRQS